MGSRTKRRTARKRRAQETNADHLRQLAEVDGAVLVGVMGFSGSWEHNSRADAEAIAREQLTAHFVSRTGLWCVSGATNVGVPKLAYEVAEKLELTKVGVTAKAAYAFPLASLDHLIVVGESFGDESETFISLCDEFLLIGGGPQSERETRMASSLAKPITIVRGLGGVADTLDISASYIDL